MVYNSHTTKFTFESVQFSGFWCIYKKLYDHQHYLILEQFQSPPKEMQSHVQLSSCCLLLCPGSHKPIFCLCDIPILDISYKWSHNPWPLCLAFSISIIFSRFINVVAYIVHFPLYG